MKKQYVKPKIEIQNLMINNFAAGSCGDQNGIIVNYSEDTCVSIDEESGMTFFGDNCGGNEWSVNIVNPNPKSPYAQLCYHRPLDTINFFSS